MNILIPHALLQFTQKKMHFMQKMLTCVSLINIILFTNIVLIVATYILIIFAMKIF